MPLDAIILAAGRASRVGVPKALLPAGPGLTFLSRAIELGRAAAGGDLLVVMGYERAMMQAEIARWSEQGRDGRAARLRVIVNDLHMHGQSTSLRAAMQEGRGDGALVLLVDQPAIPLEPVRGLVKAWRERSPHIHAVAGASRGEQRTPVILGRALFPEVLALEGDQGARRVLRRDPSRVELIEWGDAPWQGDVDAWVDYARLARMFGWDSEAPDGEADVTPATLAQQWAALSAREADPARRLAGLRRLALAALRAEM